LLLGIQFRWLLTRGKLASDLVTPAELAIDDAKEAAWMDMYDHDHDTLEDILYHRLQDLWALLTDSMKVFNENGATQPLCAQKVWEALLTAFPLDHKRMQTALLARELARMIRWGWRLQERNQSSFRLGHRTSPSWMPLTMTKP
jgi:hypothetical protein